MLNKQHILMVYIIFMLSGTLFSVNYFELGDTYLSNNNYETALLYYFVALRTDTDVDYAPLYNNIGFTLFKQNDFLNSLIHYKKALKYKPDYPTCYNNIGIVYYQMNDYENAEKSFKKAIELNPRYSKAMINLALVYFRQYNFIDAYTTYKKAKNIDNEYVANRVTKKKIKKLLSQEINKNPDNKKLKYINDNLNDRNDISDK